MLVFILRLKFLKNYKMENKIYLEQQKNEITEHIVYLKLSHLCSDLDNKKILKQISKDELKHYNFIKSITNCDVKPSMRKVTFYVLIAKILGLAFALRLMERGEGNAQNFYDEMAKVYPEAKEVSKDELEHEKDLIGILEDEKLSYASSIVLGLNDALVELTGTLAGLTIAFGNPTTIAITGIILGFAASLSMAASEYLSVKEEGMSSHKAPIKSALYTGSAYIITVIFLVLPYFIFSNVYYSLGLMLFLALIIIATYTYYISVAKDVLFKPRFFQMILISFGVAIISFIFGYIVDKVIM